MEARIMAILAASTAMVTASSSMSGTDFSKTFRLLAMSSLSPQTLAISSAFILYLGT